MSNDSSSAVYLETEGGCLQNPSFFLVQVFITRARDVIQRLGTEIRENESLIANAIAHVLDNTVDVLIRQLHAGRRPKVVWHLSSCRIGQAGRVGD